MQVRSVRAAARRAACVVVPMIVVAGALLPLGAVLGGGTIDTSGATVAAGAAPTQGAVTIDSAATPASPPALLDFEPFTAPGIFSRPMAFLGDVGDGSDGAFVATSNVALAGGEHQYTSYTIENGATVTYSTSVVLHVTGDVVLRGRIESTSSIEIFAGGSLVVEGRNGSPVTGVFTTTELASVRIETGGAIELGVADTGSGTVSPRCAISLERGDVLLVAGAEETAPRRDLTCAGSLIATGEGYVEALAGDGISLTDTTLASEGDVLRLYEYGAGLLVDASSVAATRGNMWVETAGPIELRNASSLRALLSDMDVRSHYGTVTLGGASQLYGYDGAGASDAVGEGAIALRAGDGLLVHEDSSIDVVGTGDITVVAVRYDQGPGGLQLGDPDSFDVSAIRQQGDGDVFVDVGYDAVLYGATAIIAQNGGVRLQAPSSSLVIAGDVLVQAGGGPLDVRVDEMIRTEQAGTTWDATLIGASVSLVARGTGVLLDLTTLRAASGPLTVHGDYSVDIHATSSVTAAGALTIRVNRDLLRLVDTTVETDPVSGPSAPVLLEAFGGSDALLDVSGSTIRSGTATTRSGDVDLLVHAPADPAPDVVDGLLVPKKAVLAINARHPERSTLKVNGTLDTGRGAPSLAGPATVTLGSTAISGTLAADGTDLVLSAEGLTFTFKPSRSGGSRGTFSLTWRSAGAAALAPDGPLALRVVAGGLDLRSSVVLSRGRFKLGQTAGRLSEPRLFPYSVVATHSGAGRDALSVQLGYVPAAPVTGAPDFALRYRDDLVLSVAAADLTRRGNVISARRPASAPQVDRLRIDLARERIEVVARRLDLGALPAAPVATTLGVTLGTDVQTVGLQLVPVPRRHQLRQ